MNLIGQIIDRYSIIEQVGEGGMATVYKAFDTHLERDVAIKIIRKEMFSPDTLERVMQRFDREGRALAKLSHPNIVRIYDHGVYQDSPYLVMEFVDAGTLKSIMGKPIPWKDAVQLILPIAEALSYAHQNGIIHRDIKPANILLNTRGQPLLTDFGIAKLLEDDEGHTITGLGVGIGTPAYMSPEQGQGLLVDERTDIYSLGIIFYEMITGRKPYHADTPLALVYQHVNEPLPPIHQFITNIPDQVESLINISLAKKAANRFMSMKALVNALKSLSSVPSTQTTIENIPTNPHPNDHTDQFTYDSLITLPTQDGESSSGLLIEGHVKKSNAIWKWLVCSILGLILISLAVLFSLQLIPGLSQTNSENTNNSSLTQDDIQPTPRSSPTADTIHNTTNTQPTPTRQPTPIPTYFPITNCGPSRLHVGDSVYVSLGGTHNDIRTEADTHPANNTVEESYQGDVLQIIGGPECDASGSHWVMWEVRTSNGNVGWTPEANGSDFWLTPMETFQACSGALMSRLRPGDQAHVSNNGVASTMRQDPSTSAGIIDFLDPGWIVEILDGPTCNDGYVWYHVQPDQSSQSGWVVEGDTASYWLIPIIVP